VVLRLAVGLLSLSVLAFGGPAADAAPNRVFAPRTVGEGQVSSNWAGYALTGTNASGTATSYSNVVGSWVQPKVTCTARQPSYSAFWVGLGGFSDDAQALEQIGTESNCDTRGRPVYAAWYEIGPAPSIPIAMKMAPGDRMTAAVLVQGTQVTLQLTNTTRHIRVTRRVTVQQPDLTSAEWIAEAPSSCSSSGQCRTLPLADFGTVSFARAAATGDGHAGPISDPAWQATPVELAELGQDGLDPSFAGMQPPLATSGASPGPLSADGRGFAVAWHPASD
jgi:Peptidase A4 family